MTSLTGPRLILRSVRKEDEQALVALHTSAEVRAYLGGPLTEQEARTRFARHLSANPQHHWAIANTQMCMGLIMLHPHHDGEGMEVSYLLLPQFWRQGYAHEALLLVMAYAKQIGLPHLLAETQVANVASCRLLERVGMRRVKVLERFGAQQALYKVVFETQGDA